MKVKHLLPASLFVFALTVSEASLTICDINIANSGVGTNGSLSLAGTASPVDNNRRVGGNWVLTEIEFDLLVGPAVQPEMPAIQVQPGDTVALIGQSLAIPITVSGTPPLTYHWRQSGTNLVNQTNSALLLPQVTTNSAGNYDVVVSNPFGSVTSVVATVTVSGIFALQTSSPALNPLTGTYEEQVTLTNIGGPITGLRLLVGSLPSRVSLYNVAGTNNGMPYAQFAITMNSGDTATFLLQFFNPYRLNFTNTVQMEAVAALPASTNGGTGIVITDVFMDKSNPNSTRFTFGFVSIAGRSYQVLYSDDELRTWTVANTVTASANYTIWTEMLPAANTRFFKVVAVP